MTLLEQDLYRCGRMPHFQRYLRLCQQTPKNSLRYWLYIRLYLYYCRVNCIEIPVNVEIGGGCYIGHPYCITINSQAVIGKNVNIHKGVTIGTENRGLRKGAPTIGNRVWIGVNSTIVGKITIGDDVLIAPNTFVNRDIPSHSVVYGNPCMIKHKDNATEGYVENTID